MNDPVWPRPKSDSILSAEKMKCPIIRASVLDQISHLLASKSPPIAFTPCHKCINLDGKGLNSSPSPTTKAGLEIFVRVNTLTMCNQMVTSEIRE